MARPLWAPEFLGEGRERKFLSLLHSPVMNTHFGTHIGTNTCAVKLGGVVFDPRQVHVVISALHVLVLAVKSPDWPPVDTLLGLCCCSLTKTVISPAQKRRIPKSILVTLKYLPGSVVPSGLAGVKTSLIFRGGDVTLWADLTTDVSRTLCKEVIRLCMSWEIHKIHPLIVKTVQTPGEMCNVDWKHNHTALLLHCTAAGRLEVTGGGEFYCTRQ